MKRTVFTAALVALFLASSQMSEAAPIVFTTDFIANGTRTQFNGFEAIPNDGVYFTGGMGPYLEDGIEVLQVNGDPPNDTWVTSSFWAGFEGSYGWYPDGADNGYTRVTLAGGVDFADVGMNTGTGAPGQSLNLLYELRDNGVVVLAGSAPLGYLGFSGGGFDEILMRDSLSGGTSVTDGSEQALAIDSIETQGSVSAVPEPATLLLFGAGLAAAGARRRYRQRK